MSFNFLKHTLPHWCGEDGGAVEDGSNDYKKTQLSFNTHFHFIRYHHFLTNLVAGRIFTTTFSIQIKLDRWHGHANHN